jgi:hypothetical protein
VAETSNWEPTENELDAIRQINWVLTKIPEQLSAYREIEPIQSQPGSMLTSDDARLDPLPASALVATCLASAADCLNAVQVLTGEADHPTLWVFAQYPLLRSVLEASAKVLWLLAPEDEHERLVRNLRARATEVSQDAALFGLVDSTDIAGAAETVAATRKAMIATIATRNAIKPTEYARQLSYTEMVREGCASVDGDGCQALAVWRLISGFAHSYWSRSEMFSTRLPFEGARGPSGVSAIMANPAVVLAVLTTAQMAFTNAVAIAGRRAKGGVVPHSP